MQTGPESHSRLMLSLGLPLVCVVLALAAYSAFGGSLPFSSEGYQVRVPLPDAQSLVPGSDVRTSGVKIGEVVAIARDGDRASARIELQNRYVPMRSSATATVRVKTLLGEGYLEVAPGAPDAEPIPEGGQLSPDRVRRAVKLDDFLSTFSAETRDQMRALFAGTAAAFDGRSQSLSDSLAYGASFSVDLNTVLQSLDGQTGQLQELFASSGDVFDALGRRTGALQAAVTSANDLLDVTAERDVQLTATIRALPGFLGSLRSTSDAVTAASPELERAVAAANPVVAPLEGVVDQTIEIAPAMRSALGAYAATTRTGERGLPSLTRIVQATPKATRELYPAARELVPFLQLLGAYRAQALVGSMATATATGNGKLVGPGGKIVAHAGGLIYASNETVAGWVRRLPTDRSNPYPVPEGLLELDRQGFLSSYDCRHTGNPLYLPPLGTGVPPCVEQGPWTYRGKTAYYPRLSAAPR
jgi:phospholipid/cholesterol/gamma-HCH transport system substrate-binding protein